MKRIFLAALALALVLSPACSLAAHGSMSYDGLVEVGADIALEAPISAYIDSVNVKSGDYVAFGDVIATMRSTKAYAPVSGTVAAIFADTGYDATEVTSRYGAALFIEPTNKYTLYMDDKYAYESVGTMYPHLGDTVYLKCVTDGSHVGTGLLTAVDDEGTYTVETTSGEFYPGEAVKVFIKSRKYEVDRIGRGTVISTAPEGVTGSGYVIKRYVSVGDTVEKGQLLFETVEGLNGFGDYSGLDIVAKSDGIITEVNVSSGDQVASGAVVGRMCPMENLSVKLSLTEDELSFVKKNDQMLIVFEQIPGELRLNGTVSDILYIPESVLEADEKDDASTKTQEKEQETEEETDDTVRYSAYIDFPAAPEIRLGMNATVYSVN